MSEHQILPIDGKTFKAEYAKAGQQSGWILTARDRDVGELYVLRGYATVFLADNCTHGAVCCLLKQMREFQPFRLPGPVGLSWGNHTVEEVQRVLDEQVIKLGKTADKREWLLGLAGRVCASNTYDNTVTIEPNELGIYQELNKSGFRITANPYTPRKR